MNLAAKIGIKKTRIEIVPLIDVVFLLLASFIYGTLSMTVVRTVGVDLPKASGVVEKDDGVTITITADNRVLLEGENVELPAAVKEAVRLVGEGRKRITVKGDRVSDLGIAVEILSGLRQAGITAVSFQVEDQK